MLIPLKEITLLCVKIILKWRGEVVPIHMTVNDMMVLIRKTTHKEQIEIGNAVLAYDQKRRGLTNTERQDTQIFYGILKQIKQRVPKIQITEWNYDKFKLYIQDKKGEIFRIRKIASDWYMCFTCSPIENVSDPSSIELQSIGLLKLRSPTNVLLKLFDPSTWRSEYYLGSYKIFDENNSIVSIELNQNEANTPLKIFLYLDDHREFNLIKAEVLHPAKKFINSYAIETDVYDEFKAKQHELVFVYPSDPMTVGDDYPKYYFETLYINDGELIIRRALDIDDINKLNSL